MMDIYTTTRRELLRIEYTDINKYEKATEQYGCFF